MRISDILRASCVGALVFTPAMAQSVEQVHEEALRVLHERLGQQGTGDSSQALSMPGSPYTAPDADLASERAERARRIKAEAQERLSEQERMQAARRTQFEQWVKDRERLRRDQRAYEENAARGAGLIREPASEVHTKALETLHAVQGQPQAATSSGFQPFVAASPAAPSAPAMQLAQGTIGPGSPRTQMAQSTTGPGSAMSADNANDVHQQALEVLHQIQSGGMNSSSASAPGMSSTPSATPQPSPELQRRLQEMQAELEQEQVTRRAATTSSASSISDNYIRDLEQRAQQELQQGMTVARPNSMPTPPAAAPLDSRTREMLQRQDAEIAARLGTMGANTAMPAPSAPPAMNAAPTATPPPMMQPPATAMSAPPMTHTTATDTSNVQYSKELEERARQILLERAQQQQSAAAAPASMPSAQPAAMPSPSAGTMVQPPSTTTFTTNPPMNANAPAGNIQQVHSQAMQALDQIQSGQSAGPRSKQQRLKELTDLYRADKLSPAEYHQKRAQIIAEP